MAMGRCTPQLVEPLVTHCIVHGCDHALESLLVHTLPHSTQQQPHPHQQQQRATADAAPHNSSSQAARAGAEADSSTLGRCPALTGAVLDMVLDLVLDLASGSASHALLGPGPPPSSSGAAAAAAAMANDDFASRLPAPFWPLAASGEGRRRAERGVEDQRLAWLCPLLGLAISRSGEPVRFGEEQGDDWPFKRIRCGLSSSVVVLSSVLHAA